MQKQERTIKLPWSDDPFTEEEQRELDEYEKTHTYHPEFYMEYDPKPTKKQKRKLASKANKIK